MKKTLLLLSLILICFSVRAQYTTVPQKKSEREKYLDSLKNVKYPYVFPALGAKAQKKGFDIILPHGVMLNSIYTKQDIELSDLSVGFNTTDLTNIDSIVVFDHVTGEGVVTNFRFDTYIFPFLNVYLLAGTMNGNTSIALAEPIQFSTTTSNPGQYYGFGMMLAGGVGKYWITSDINFAWTDLELLDHPVKTRVAGLRFGRTFNFNKHPQQNIAFWVAAQNQKIFNETNGQISFSELGLTGSKIEEMSTQLDTWYNNLPPAQQKLYENMYTKLSEGFDNAANNIENGYVRYHFSKSLATPWHVSLGAQWQVNKRWQFRGEAGGAYKKQQFMISVGYRFGIKGRNIASGTKEERKQ